MIYANDIKVDGSDVIKDGYFIIPVDTIYPYVKKENPSVKKIPYRVPKSSTLQHIANDILAKQLDIYTHNATPELAKQCYNFSAQIYENVSGPEIEIFDALMLIASADNVKKNDSFEELMTHVCNVIYEDTIEILEYVKRSFKGQHIYEKCFEEDQ